MSYKCAGDQFRSLPTFLGWQNWREDQFKPNQNTRFTVAVTDVRPIESPGPTDAAVPPFLLEEANGSITRGSIEEVERASRAGKLFLKSLARNVRTVTAAARFKLSYVCWKTWIITTRWTRHLQDDMFKKIPSKVDTRCHVVGCERPPSGKV